MSITTLKVKIVSLAFEAAYIRRQAQRKIQTHRRINAAVIAKYGDTSRRLKESCLHDYHQLYGHRMGLRSEQRAALLAYAWIRDVPYCAVERVSSMGTVNTRRVAEIIRSHAPAAKMTPYFGISGINKPKLEQAINEWIVTPAASVPKSNASCEQRPS